MVARPGPVRKGCCSASATPADPPVTGALGFDAADHHHPRASRRPPQRGASLRARRGASESARAQRGLRRAAAWTVWSPWFRRVARRLGYAATQTPNSRSRTPEGPRPRDPPGIRFEASRYLDRVSVSRSRCRSGGRNRLRPRTRTCQCRRACTNARTHKCPRARGARAHVRAVRGRV